MKKGDGLKNASMRGFSLLEIVVVVAILGILASIAYPSYLRYLKSGKRADMQAAMLDLGTAIERRGSNAGYANITLGSLNNPGYWPTSGEKSYNLVLNISGSEWQIIATPINSMQSDGVLILDDSGSRCWASGGGGSCSLSDNW